MVAPLSNFYKPPEACRARGMPPYFALIARPLVLRSSSLITAHNLFTNPIIRVFERFREGLLLWGLEDLKSLLGEREENDENWRDFCSRFSYPDLYYKKELDVSIGPVLIENCWSAPADFLEIGSKLSSGDLLSGLAGFIEECLDKDLHIVVFLDEKVASYPVDIIPILVRLLSSREVFATRACFIDEENVRQVYQLPILSGIPRLRPESQILSILSLVTLIFRPDSTPYTLSKIISQSPDTVRALDAFRIPRDPEAIRKRVARILEFLEHFCLVESYVVSNKRQYTLSALGVKLVRILTCFPHITELARYICPELRDFLQKVGSEGMAMDPQAEGYIHV